MSIEVIKHVQKRSASDSTADEVPNLPCPTTLDNDIVMDFTYPDDGNLYCNSTYNGVSCWPLTRAGHLAVLPCPSNVNGYQFDSSGNASRMCDVNGTWEDKSDYSQCFSVNNHSDTIGSEQRLIYYVGFSISTVALVIAASIFLMFRSLRCLRNTIHCHLIMTLILKNCLWLMMTGLVPILGDSDQPHYYLYICRAMVSAFQYLQVATFSWMLVEGFYLHTMIVWAFSTEKVKLWHCCSIGWCCPFFFALAWIISKSLHENELCWLPSKTSYADYICIVPCLAVLVINVFFLGSIIFVLVTKLSDSNTLQAQQYRSWKVVKATLILFPLLGLFYILFIASPAENFVSKKIFIFFNAVMQSLQGLVVAIFYCFLNGEVQTTLRGKLARWREGRGILTANNGTATRYSFATATSNEHLEKLRGSLASRNHIVSTSSNGEYKAPAALVASTKVRHDSGANQAFSWAESSSGLVDRDRAVTGPLLKKAKQKEQQKLRYFGSGSDDPRERVSTIELSELPGKQF